MRTGRLVGAGAAWMMAIACAAHRQQPIGAPPAAVTGVPAPCSAAPAAPAVPAPVCESADDDAAGDADENEATAADGANTPPPVDPAHAAELRWVNDRFPEVATYRRLDDKLLARLLDWAAPSGATVVFDRSCRPARVTRRGAVLHGFVHQQFDLDAQTPDEMSESFSELAIGFRFDEFASNWTTYRRGRQGRWQVDSESGYGDVQPVGHLLSAVTESAAWFSDAAVGLEIKCTRLLSTTARCDSGGQRTCDSCESWGPKRVSHESGFGIGSRPSRRKKSATGAADCSLPCPPIDEPPEVTRANRALENEGFVVSLDSAAKPLLFRTEAACRDYTKKHPFTAEERMAWHGDQPE